MILDLKTTVFIQFELTVLNSFSIKDLIKNGESLILMDYHIYPHLAAMTYVTKALFFVCYTNQGVRLYHEKNTKKIQKFKFLSMPSRHSSLVDYLAQVI